ncbi:helix-turn-helix transcriptional regulator [Bradyrhizobium australafricanum]|uniref:helix-turn-helix transcriptional regulator n=1 Tax=Bradyrhizobium australafricanum TaxID=2821406 RepID=UPI001CE2BECE|nr:helix-turn-helix transcriptional regulator [Bradyrhizobium australafricanum]MCA6098650.1 helix-turn-helix transcriptional regulator [Bradyrhizobium australafricanum]
MTAKKARIEANSSANFASQTEFATLVKSTQQTVSRWEAGQSRPRDKQMPLIAAVLKAHVADLLAAAGFTQKTAVLSFDQPFPIALLGVGEAGPWETRSARLMVTMAIGP